MKSIIIILINFFLLIASFSLNAQKKPWDNNKSKWTKLMKSVYKGNNNKVLRLINKGVNVNDTLKNGLSAFYISIRKGNNKAAKILINTHKLKIKKVHGYMSIFWFACQNCNTEILDYIVEQGFDVNDTLENGNSILMNTTIRGPLENIKFLLNKGANPNHQCSGGETALMQAAFMGDIEKVKLLLQYNSDKNLKDCRGCRAIDFAYGNIYPYIRDNSKVIEVSILD